MSHYPKEPKDLALAPVAVNVDENLRYLRSRRLEEVDATLVLELDDPLHTEGRDVRSERVLRAALRGVDLHGWQAAVTEDLSAIRLTGGSVSLDVALGATMLRYLEQAPVPS